MAVPSASQSGSSRYVAWLGAAGDAALVGGKGASLDRLVRHGFLVPPAFCVTTTAFREHVAGAGAPGAITAALAGLPNEEARVELATLVEGAPMPGPVRDALDGSVERLVCDPTGFGRQTGFAVRSSAIGEDGTSQSFAGLHDTELGLKPGEIEAAVRRCWASVWSRPAIAYRARRGLPFDSAVMAVVVQALVPADAAVVVFTRHPVTGRDDQLVINALRGLGEPMVSGTATPDQIVVDRKTRAVVEFSPADAGERLLARDGGVERVVESTSGPALDPAQLEMLVALAGQVEEAFGCPVDIEAAVAGDRWYLLQARPITTS